MDFLDIILGLTLVWGLYRGFINGLFIELASLIALIAGIYGAIHFSFMAGDYLAKNMDWDPRYISLISFVITFIIIVVVVHMAGKLLTKIANFAMLGFLNKIAGAVFGTLKIAVILGALLIFFDRINDSVNIIDETTKEKSILYSPIKEIGAYAFGTVLGQLYENKERE
ncbi:CvpA family protein [Flavobacteriaceae bacterium F89]|uniref:CvpA family protein n=1 Tax=Cerina litoralis TaxID=2874477 RepID=A0AAE3JN18_9FLAO|nr:CvpA family protein [Cerina litoralis]MCG2459406.1 CvpA family protein [Cerina litoralis]